MMFLALFSSFVRWLWLRRVRALNVTRTVERSAKTKRRRRAMRTRLGDIVQDSFTSNVYASPVASGQISQSGGLFDQPANPIPDWAWFVGGAIVALFVFGGKR